uniref:P2Y purinoceptor 11 n=1 Tax=Nothobranchius rachovii TaxID=451742 RepID=A0A1A8R3N8_9TELE
MASNFSSCEGFQIGVLPYMYGLEFLVALAGNVFALWLLFTKERRNWHTGVVLSCNLAISDLLYILTLPLLIVYYSNRKEWVFGDAMCKTERFLFTCNLYVSIFFVMAISVNRLWKFASICPDANNKGNTVCVSFCDSKDPMPHFTHKLFLTVFGCLVPFLVTFTSYCLVIRVVWQNASLTVIERRKVTLLVTSVIALYAVSFIPYHFSQICHFYQKIYNPHDSTCGFYIMYQVSKGLATLNMCIHPVLYMAVFDSIRVACCGNGQEQDHEQT